MHSSTQNVFKHNKNCVNNISNAIFMNNKNRKLISVILSENIKVNYLYLFNLMLKRKIYFLNIYKTYRVLRIRE